MRELEIARTAKETEPVNPQFHVEFVELCALFYTGELSDEEWALLQIHMAYCDDCRLRFEQYKHVAKELIPAMAAAAASETYVPYESDASLADAERALFDKISQTKPVASPQTERREARSWWRSFFVPPAISALAAGLAVAGFYHFSAGRAAHPGSQAIASVSTPVSTPSAAVPLTPLAHTEQTAELATLRQQLADANGKSAKEASASNALQAKLTEEQTQRSNLLAEKESLGTQLSVALADAQRLRGELDSSRSDSSQHSVHIADLEGRVRSLNVALEEAQTSLDEKERMLALDKDFLAHDRDIRDVIGARNLYIADIFDTTESGKTAKPFGRIFYTQDRSLVFYGFDLEKKAGAKRAVAYQAWGSGTDRSPVSLGLFYQDDTHKRWVLRCSDAKTLSRLNMVFVTIEPEGGSRTPTGQQFLRAYLQIQPNHP